MVTYRQTIKFKDKKRSKRLTRFIKWFFKTYINTKNNNNKLTIKIASIFDLEGTDPYYMALIYVEDAIPSLKNRNYKICIKERFINTNSFWRLIAHEMWHFKQYTDHTLIERVNGSVWKGKLYSNFAYYSQIPWERQAYKMEKIVFKEFKKYEKKSLTKQKSTV
jgi:hypothetical protein